MAKINVTGDAMVVTSKIKFCDLEMAMKRKPEALMMYVTDEDGSKTTDFGFATCEAPAMSAYGIIFNGHDRSDEGFATLTCMLPSGLGATEAKEYIAKKYGVCLHKLNQYEDEALKAIEEIKEREEAIMNSIVVDQGDEVESDIAE